MLQQQKIFTLGRSTLRLLKKFIPRSFPIFGYDVHLTATKRSVLKLPKVSVSSIMSGGISIKTLEPVSADGNVTLLELLTLNTLVARLSPKILFEIGTFDGRTTLNLTANANPGAQTFTLDLPREELTNTVYALHAADVPFANKPVSGQRFSNTRWNEQIVQLYGDSAKFDFQPYHGRVGFTFIDGSHAYDYVKNDTEAALRLVTNPSFIVWHDYTPRWPGVIRHLEELHLAGGIFAGLRHIQETSLVFLPLGISI